MATSSTHVAALVESPPLLADVRPPNASGVYLNQTGLRWPAVRVFNPSPLSDAAVRVVIHDLTPGATVYNASRTNALGQPYVQYSSDLASWKTAFPPVAGSGSTMQWVDNGPPKTDSHPSTRTNRFYRVLLAP